MNLAKLPIFCEKPLSLHVFLTRTRMFNLMADPSAPKPTKRPWVTPKITPVLLGTDTEGGGVGGVTEGGHVISSTIHCPTSGITTGAPSNSTCGTGTISSS